MRSPAVEVSIDELVLHGFERRDRDALVRGLEHELSRLVAESPPGFFGHERTIDHLDAGTVTLPAPSDPHAAGVGAARAVIGGLGR